MLFRNKKEQTIDTTQMNFKSIILSKRRQSQMAVYCMIQFVRHSGKSKTIGSEYRSEQKLPGSRDNGNKKTIWGENGVIK